MQKILLCLIFFSSIIINSNYITAQPAGDYSFTSDKHSTTIPFKISYNHIIISAKLNNQTDIELVLDTGMPANGALLYGGPEIDAVEFQTAGEVLVGGPGSAPVPAKLAGGVSLRIGDIEFTNQTMIVMPYDSVLSFFARENGVIGLEIFSRFVVDIDYDRNLITLTEPEYFKYTDAGEELPIEIVRNFPYINCTITMESGKTVEAKLVMDIGASHALSLNLGSQEEIVLPEKSIDVQTGRSVSAKVFGKIGRIKNIKVGSYTIDDALVAFYEKPLHPAAKEGNLGSGIFRRFNTIIDYNSKRIFIKPNKSFNDPFEFMMSGLQVSKNTEGFFVVDRIIPNSPASEAGILQDDRIIEANGKPASGIDAEIFNKLCTKEGETVTLKIRRGNTEHTVSLKLRRII